MVNVPEKLFRKYKAIKKKKTEYCTSDEKAVLEFISHIKDFYKAYDIHENTKHARIFELLFLSNRKLSGENISQKMFISPKTLYRFKKQYIDFVSAALKEGIFGDEIGQILTDLGVMKKIQ